MRVIRVCVEEKTKHTKKNYALQFFSVLFYSLLELHFLRTHSITSSYSSFEMLKSYIFNTTLTFFTTFQTRLRIVLSNCKTQLDHKLWMASETTSGDGWPTTSKSNDIDWKFGLRFVVSSVHCWARIEYSIRDNPISNIWIRYGTNKKNE